VENAEKEIVKVIKQASLDGAIHQRRLYKQQQGPLRIWCDVTEKFADEYFQAWGNQDREAPSTPFTIMAELPAPAGSKQQIASCCGHSRPGLIGQAFRPEVYRNAHHLDFREVLTCAILRLHHGARPRAWLR